MSGGAYLRQVDDDDLVLETELLERGEHAASAGGAGVAENLDDLGHLV